MMVQSKARDSVHGSQFSWSGFSAAAHAYLDPGTGSILVQSLLAGIAGAAAVISLYWQRLKAFFVNHAQVAGCAHQCNFALTTTES